MIEIGTNPFLRWICISNRENQMERFCLQHFQRAHTQNNEIWFECPWLRWYFVLAILTQSTRQRHCRQQYHSISSSIDDGSASSSPSSFCLLFPFVPIFVYRNIPVFSFVMQIKMSLKSLFAKQKVRKKTNIEIMNKKVWSSEGNDEKSHVILHAGEAVPQYFFSFYRRMTPAWLQPANMYPIRMHLRYVRALLVERQHTQYMHLSWISHRTNEEKIVNDNKGTSNEKSCRFPHLSNWLRYNRYSIFTHSTEMEQYIDFPF